MRAFRSIAAVSLSLVGLVLAYGCSRQGEGERCVYSANGNADCNDGLVCVPYTQLQSGASDKTDRCCPPSGSSDLRCAPAVSGITTDAGSDGSVDSGSSGSGGSGGGNSGSGGQAGAQ